MTQKRKNHFELDQPWFWLKAIAVVLVAHSMLFSSSWLSQACCKELPQPGCASELSKRQLVRFERTDRALVYSRDINKGSVLQLNDFYNTEIAELKLPPDAINYETIAEGRTIQRNVRKGSMVRLRDIGMTLIPNYLPQIPYLSGSPMPQPLLYAARRIGAGSLITYKDLETRKVMMNKIPPNSIVSPYGAIGRKAAVDIAKGKIIFESEVGLAAVQIDRR